MKNPQDDAKTLHDAITLLRKTWVETSSQLDADIPDVVLVEQVV